VGLLTSSARAHVRDDSEVRRHVGWPVPGVAALRRRIGHLRDTPRAVT
jgi:hypothetical protein